MNFTLFCALIGAFVGVTLAYYDGNYIPKSFYVIDHFGHKSEPVYIRNRRDVGDMHPFMRVKRSDSQASASSHASSSAGSSAGSGGGGGGYNNAHTQNYGGGGGYSPGASEIYNPYWFWLNLQPWLSYYNQKDYNPSFVNPDDFFRQLQDMLNFIGGQAGHGQAFASSFSSANSGNAPNYGGSGQGGLGSGQDAGYHGAIPTLFSRFGETQGNGIQVSGSAQGEKGAFSSSSTSIDSDGKIKYSVQSGKL